MMNLRKAVESDCPLIHAMQVKSFAALLEKYQDFNTSPAAEGLERIQQRFAQPFTDYYLICRNDRPIGALRVCDYGESCRLSPIFVLPEFLGHGYARQAMTLAEERYPQAKEWTLDTILQEEKLCHFYEKMGYRKTGKYEKIKDGMDLVFYAKKV